MAEIKQKLKTPNVPNYIIIEGPPGLKQDGFQESSKISIADLSDVTLKQIGEEWTFKLLQNANRIRRQSGGMK